MSISPIIFFAWQHLEHTLTFIQHQSPGEALINSTNEMKCEAHGTLQPGPINLIGEEVSTAQRSNSLVQSINQRFPRVAKHPR